MSEQEGIERRRWTFELTCGECQSQSTLPNQEIALGENTADFTCSGCGEQWHIRIEATSLNPLRVNLSTIQHTVGVLKDGVFFAKEQMQ